MAAVAAAAAGEVKGGAAFLDQGRKSRHPGGWIGDSQVPGSFFVIGFVCHLLSGLPILCLKSVGLMPKSGYYNSWLCRTEWLKCPQDQTAFKMESFKCSKFDRF